MVAPPASSITRFLVAPPEAVGGFLLFGSDAPQIASRAEALANILSHRAEPQGEIVRLHDADMAADPGRLIVELSTRPLFGGRNVVWLTSLPAKIHAALLEAIERPVSDCYLIAQAPDLKKSHKIVQAFEAAPYLAAIACYGEDRASLSQTIRQHVNDLGCEIDADALEAVIARSNSSASLARREAEKLCVYAGPLRRITLTDVEACLSDQQISEVHEAVDAALEGEGRKAMLAFERLMAGGENIVPVLAAISSALQRLSSLRASADSGVPIAQAIKDFRPPVFFKQQDALARQARLWSQDTLTRALRRLNEVLKETRLRPALAQEITLQFLLDLAKIARGQRKR